MKALWLLLSTNNERKWLFSKKQIIKKEGTACIKEIESEAEEAGMIVAFFPIANCLITAGSL